MSSSEKISLPSTQRSALFSFIKSIASFKGDLSSITAPPFLLSPQSVTEYSAFWAEHPSLFVAASHEDDAQKRALCVLKWFLSTLKEQHSSKDENGKRKRKLKPLNAFLGEQFLGKWVDESGTTELVSEQVSHHPPATAFNVWNNDHGVRLQGFIIPKVTFSGTVNIDRKGYGVLHIDKYNEDHLVTMPKVHVEGLVTGAPQPELSGTSYLRSSSGYTTKIEYFGKGWISGTRNGFKATIFPDNKENEPIYIAEGTWSGKYTIKEVATNTILETFDIDTIPKTPLDVAPLEHQNPMESRRAWRYVVDAINAGDIFAVSQAKSKIENEQRQLRRVEKAEARPFSRRYFSRVQRDPVADKLVEGLRNTSIMGDSDANQMVWVWDEEKYQQVRECLRNGVKSPTHARFDSAVSGMDIGRMGMTRAVS